MKTKTEFKYFDITQHEKEQDYLRKMHNSGWKFIGVNLPGFYHFEACEPEDVIYQLDYNPDGVANKAEYIQMFEDLGWEYLLDFVGYSYFRKPAEETNPEESIFCDEESRLDMLVRVMKGRLIPLVAIFFLIIVPYFVNFVIIRAEGTPSFLRISYIILAIVYLVIFAKVGISYVNLKRRIKK